MMPIYVDATDKTSHHSAYIITQWL